VAHRSPGRIYVLLHNDRTEIRTHKCLYPPVKILALKLQQSMARFSFDFIKKPSIQREKNLSRINPSNDGLRTIQYEAGTHGLGGVNIPCTAFPDQQYDTLHTLRGGYGHDKRRYSYSNYTTLHFTAQQAHLCY
jgi:hypothetical protein